MLNSDSKRDQLCCRHDKWTLNQIKLNATFDSTRGSELYHMSQSFPLNLDKYSVSRKDKLWSIVRSSLNLDKSEFNFWVWISRNWTLSCDNDHTKTWFALKWLFVILKSCWIFCCFLLDLGFKVTSFLLKSWIQLCRVSYTV